MKNKVTIYILLFINTINIAYSQRTIITNDSLRNHFKKESIIEVLNYLLKYRDYSLDYKDLYSDKVLKNLLLRWLDSDVIISYELNTYTERFKERFEYDKEQETSFTKRYIEQKAKLNYDSLSMDTAILKIYTEKAIKEFVNNNIKNSFLEKKEELIPDPRVLFLHSRIVYPEAYKKIKYWWYLNNKEQKSALYYCMLEMNDPEAQAMYDECLKEFIRSKEQGYPYYLSMPNIERVANAYAVKKLLELLPITRLVLVISGDPPIPHDEIILTSLISLCNRYEMKVASYSPELVITLGGYDKYIQYLREHKKDIIDAANRLIIKLEKDEEYWMQNIPFGYVPNIQKESEK